jgi:quercetin dioxygenase-like cupin family protein
MQQNRTVNGWALVVCAVMVSFVAAQGTSLLGQQPSSVRPETVQLKTVPVRFDSAYGAAIARFGEGKYGEGRLHQMDATLVEIPPGGKLPAHRHLAEEMIYIVSGTGYTDMWTGSGADKKRYDWAASDVVSPSLNVWHEHGNASSTEPARFLSITSTPLMKKIFGDARFLSSSDYVFEQRWQRGLQEPRFLQIERLRDGRMLTDGSSMSIGHIVKNMMAMKMPAVWGDVDYPETGINVLPPDEEAGGTLALTGMAGNRLFEWQNREYIREYITHEGSNHHHAWEVVYVCPVGEMEMTLKRAGSDEVRKVNWQEGDMLIVEADEVHYPGSKVIGTRFLQFKVSGWFRGTGIPGGGMGGG